MSQETSPATRLAAKKRALLAQLLQERGIQGPTGDTIVRRSHARETPLSFAQQRLWFLDQLEPESPRYIVFTGFRLQGTLQVSALTRSLSEIVRRHEALRVRFLEVDGQPQLHVVPAKPFPLRMTDLAGFLSAEQATEVQRLGLAEARRPFDLAEGPLFRCQLVRLSDTVCVLSVTMHHIDKPNSIENVQS